MQQGFGRTIGIALGTTVFQHRLEVHRTLLAQQQNILALGWDESLAPVRELVHRVGALGQRGELQIMALLQRHLHQQAAVAAYQDCFGLVLMVCLASMVLLLMLRKMHG